MTNEIGRRSMLLGLSTAAAIRAQTSADPFDEFKQLLAAKDPMIWLFTGDSITHGATHTMGWRSYPEHFAERIRWELQRRRDLIVNSGISGDRMSGLLKEVEWRVFQFKPRVVSLMMGMNDCQEGLEGRGRYRANLETFVRLCRDRKAGLILHTMNTVNLPADKDPRRDLAAYVDIIREVAAGEKVALVDHYAHWQDRFKKQTDLLYALNEGYIHPNHFGHVEIAKEMFRRLGIFDPESRTCRLFVP